MKTFTATMDVSPVLVDSNVLLSATDRRRPLHQNALAVLLSPARLVTSAQVLREYIVVCTRPRDVNGLGLMPDEAVDNVRLYLEAMPMLVESHESVVILSDLIAHYQLRGKRIHDANLVATALGNGVQAILTENLADFASLRGRIEVLDLAAERV